MPIGADFLQQQVKLAEVGLGDATRRQDWSTVLLLPALFHGTEALGQPHGALLAVGVLEHVKQHRHADRTGLKSAAQIGLGATGMTQPVLEKDLEILQLLLTETGHCRQRPRGNHRSSLRCARWRMASLRWRPQMLSSAVSATRSSLNPAAGMKSGIRSRGTSR